MTVPDSLAIPASVIPIGGATSSVAIPAGGATAFGLDAAGLSSIELSEAVFKKPNPSQWIRLHHDAKRNNRGRLGLRLPVTAPGMKNQWR